MPSDFAPATLTISLDAISANYKRIQHQTSAVVAATVKADAYGTGAGEVFKTLRKEGCADFFVATPDEAAELRALDKAANIFILGGLLKGAEDFLIKNNTVPVLNSFEEIVRYAGFANTRKLPAILHFDTGMNRLGLGGDETKKLMDDPSILAPFDLKLIMSHFACSDEKDNPMNDAQAATFSGIAAHFRNVPKSLCNSSAIFRNPDWHYDMVRPGYALYGGNPLPETTNPLRSVVTLEAKILQIRTAKKGETAGYGATHIFERDTTLATIACGYADGFLRGGGNKAKLYCNGQACPIRGRVSMDLIIIDIGDIKGKPPQAGDLIEILGPHQSVDALAEDCGTIGYEILTSLGSRYRRVYV